MNVLDLNVEELSQEELDYWDKKLKNKTDVDSKIMYDHIEQEQNTRNELADEFLDFIDSQ